MVYGIYQSAGGLQVNQYRQSVLANNLANVDTVGFKHDLTTVTERLTATREPGGDPFGSAPLLDELTGGSIVAPTYTTHKQGSLEQTDRPLDMALAGAGYFAVEKDGQEHYTRDGRFAVDANGRLVTVAGNNPVLGVNGQPIVVPNNVDGPVAFDGNGHLRAGEEDLGKVMVVGFDDEQMLRKVGQNLFTNMGANQTDSQANLRVGMIEKSTVDAMPTMVSMIEATRAYQLNATMVGLADSTLGRAVNDIPRIR